MKTTILFWGRAEGKTNELIDRMHDHRVRHLKKLFITHNQTEIERVKREYRLPPNTEAFSCIALEGGMARGMSPDLIYIDNADVMNASVFFKEIAPMLRDVKELVVAGTTRCLFDLFNHEVFSTSIPKEEKPMTDEEFDEKLEKAEQQLREVTGHEIH